MDNSDMDGAYFGGGELEYVVQDGEIYVNLDQLSAMFLATANHNLGPAQDGEFVSVVLVHALSSMAEDMDRLRSELLKREIEASFKLDDFETSTFEMIDFGLLNDMTSGEEELDSTRDNE
jgi:hypothetical protein